MNKDQANEKSALEILKDIRNKKLAPESLSVEVRREVILCLTAEGVSTSQMAELPACSDRNIRRDRAANRKANALKVHADFAEELAGDILIHASNVADRLVRIAFDKKTDPSLQIAALRESFDVKDKAAARLQSLGFAPSATHRVQAELNHTFGDVPSLDALRHEIEGLEVLAPDNTEHANQLRDLRQLMDKAESISDTPTDQPEEGGSL